MIKSYILFLLTTSVYASQAEMDLASFKDDADFITIAFLSIFLLLILIYSRKLREEVKKTQRAKQEVMKLNDALNKRVKLEVRERQEQSKMLQQQSKMASMGEMMNAVIHQWKQPLNGISMYSDIFRSDFKDNKVNQAYVDEMMDDINFLINQMTTTLTEFRDFFNTNKEVETINISECVNSVLLLSKDEFLKNQINLTVDIGEKLKINVVENEFKYVILNILNYAKDNFNKNNRKNRFIRIVSKQQKTALAIVIWDNAGGIDERLIDDIFKPNLDDEEAGIGLYMSNQIVENSIGKLKVYNRGEGACFEIKLAFAKI